jgi:2-dehydro-3-deoxyphosphogluconate aldolase/(4S)-4-hydroxy-2-oxoglutarate aldolase
MLHARRVTPHNRSMPTTTPDIDAVLGLLRAARVVPVVTITDAASAVPMTAALVDGGLPAVEITLRTAAGLDALRAAVSAAVPGALVGAGTVTTAEACEAAIDAGARFVVSPGLVEAVVAVCARHGVLALPGIATPTELLRAITLGCRTVKLFPASVLGGPPMIRALAALGTGTGFVPTGGIGLDTAPAYLAIPDVVAVGGSWMVPADRLSAGDWPGIRDLAAACAVLREVR